MALYTLLFFFREETLRPRDAISYLELYVIGGALTATHWEYSREPSGCYFESLTVIFVYTI